MSILKDNTPYLLSRDGKLIEFVACHPFVNWIANSRTPKVKVTKKNILWYAENSENEEISKLAQKCYDSIKDYTEKYIVLSKDIDDFLLLEELTNKEFCKVRTSDIKFFSNNFGNGEIYFRIVPGDFNWFDTIWNLVVQNEDFIKYVTIVKEIIVYGFYEEYYAINGHKTYMMPVEEFLTASGNPVIK